MGTDGNDFKYLSSLHLPNSTNLIIMKKKTWSYIKTGQNKRERTQSRGRGCGRDLEVVDRQLNLCIEATSSKACLVNWGIASPSVSCVHISQKGSGFKKQAQDFSLDCLNHLGARVSKLKRQPPDRMNRRKARAWHHDPKPKQKIQKACSVWNEIIKCKGTSVAKSAESDLLNAT